MSDRDRDPDSTSQVPTIVPSLTSRRPSSYAPTITSSKPLVRPTPRSAVTAAPPPSRAMSPPMNRPQSVVQRTSSAGLHAQSVQKGPTPEELIAFSGLCRALYYDKDAGAAQAVDSVLNRLPAGSRTAYARTMASVRSSYHRDEEIRRRSAVERALSLSVPGRAVMDRLQVSEGGTAAMRSTTASTERKKRVKAFLTAHCLKGLPGTIPFFQGLYAVLCLQQLAVAKGGAGKRRVEWEVDVSVFSEAGGGTWMDDSVDCLKAVLGFTEHVKAPSHSESYFADDDDDASSTGVASPPFEASSAPSSSDDEEPLDLPLPATRRAPPVVPPHRQLTLRTRATSDPFLDPNDRRTPVASGPLSPKSDQPLLPVAPLPSPTLPLLDAAPPPQFRIFTTPAYLTDPELADLLRLFPDFVTSKPTRGGKTDEESAGAQVGVGHGVIRVGAMERDEGWTGTAWQRFIRWLRMLFGG